MEEDVWLLEHHASASSRLRVYKQKEEEAGAETFYLRVITKSLAYTTTGLVAAWKKRLSCGCRDIRRMLPA
eukprot:2115412-Rhodomonas_salina.2